MLLKNLNLRLVAVCLAAASVGLSMAIVSLAKLALFLCALAILIPALPRIRPDRAFSGLYTPIAVLAAFFAFAASLVWTSAPSTDALGSIAKYGKLLLIPMMVLLIRDRREARYALTAFFLAQLFLIASSWLLFAHVPVPWATSKMALNQYAVFSSYLDQGIQGAVLAALCWHLRGFAPGRWGGFLAVTFAIVALLNVFFVLSGRSGHVVAIALLSVAIMWELPRRYQAAIVVLPFVIVMVLFFSSSKVHTRLSEVVAEVKNFSPEAQANTSSGIRLGLWRRAVQITAAHPLLGAGVGSWSTEYNRLERAQFPGHKNIDGNGNPHQEYLQWALQLGIAGLALFLAMMIAILRDSLGMDQPCRRALQSALLAMAVACLFNSSLYDALIGDFFCVLIGLLLAIGLRRDSASAIPASVTPATSGPAHG